MKHSKANGLLYNSLLDLRLKVSKFNESVSVRVLVGWRLEAPFFFSSIDMDMDRMSWENTQSYYKQLVLLHLPTGKVCDIVFLISFPSSTSSLAHTPSPPFPLHPESPLPAF